MSITVTKPFHPSFCPIRFGKLGIRARQKMCQIQKNILLSCWQNDLKMATFHILILPLFVAWFSDQLHPDLIETWGFHVYPPLDMYSLWEGSEGQIWVTVGVIRLNFLRVKGAFQGLKILILGPIPFRPDFHIDLPLQMYYHLGEQNQDFCRG